MNSGFSLGIGKGVATLLLGLVDDLSRVADLHQPPVSQRQDKVKPGILKGNAMRLLGLGEKATA